MEKAIIKQDWYQHLVEECKAIITEAVFTSRWALVEGYHSLGKRIRQDSDKKSITKLLQGLAVSLKQSERTLWYAVQVYDKYPDIQKLPEGKNITWNKLITKYLPELEENKIKIEIPRGKYSTIVIDPPWPVKFMKLEMRPNQVEMPYPTMEIDEIKKFPIDKITADNCNLFLWTTHTYLPSALEIVKEWGFKYHVLLTWNKTNGRSLFGFNRMTEFVVYAYKGKITVNQRGRFIDTIFTEKLREHSRKPNIFYEMIKNNSPTPRIDIFSREKRKGFDQWGNEISKFKGEKNG